MDYDVIVIGAGVAGLTVALKLSLQGKRVLVIEKQAAPGGLATSFRRKGFTFESSLHCVDALSGQGDIRQFLEETGVAKKLDFIELKDFCRVIYPEHDFVLNFNPENFKHYLIAQFPGEQQGISRFFLELEKFYREFDRFSASGSPHWLELASIPFFYPRMLKLSNLTFDQFTSRFIHNTKLKAIIGDIWRFAGLPPSRNSALYLAIILRGYYCYPTVYIRGGFSRLFGAIEQQIRLSGSEIKYNSLISRILTEKKKIKAVITDQGQQYKARVVVANSNALDTLTGLLDDADLKKYYLKKMLHLEKSLSAIQVYLGLKVNTRVLGMTHALCSVNASYNHEDNFSYCFDSDYEKVPLSLVDHSQIDPGLAPAGKASLVVMTLENYASWDNLDARQYQEKKQAVAEKLIARAEKYLPGLKDNIEVMEVATPRTIERFGSAPQGAIYGFTQSPGQSGFKRIAQQTRIKGLFLAGGWTWPGAGVHGCFVSGLEAAELAERFC